MLQAIGGLRTQIRHMIWVEAMLIGVIGLVLGLGAASYTCAKLAAVGCFGIQLAYEYPFGIAP